MPWEFYFFQRSSSWMTLSWEQSSGYNMARTTTSFTVPYWIWTHVVKSRYIELYGQLTLFHIFPLFGFFGFFFSVWLYRLAKMKKYACHFWKHLFVIHCVKEIENFFKEAYYAFPTFWHTKTHISLSSMQTWCTLSLMPDQAHWSIVFFSPVASAHYCRLRQTQWLQIGRTCALPATAPWTTARLLPSYSWAKTTHTPQHVVLVLEWAVH